MAEMFCTTDKRMFQALSFGIRMVRLWEMLAGSLFEFRCLRNKATDISRAL